MVILLSFAVDWYVQQVALAALQLALQAPCARMHMRLYSSMQALVANIEKGKFIRNVPKQLYRICTISIELGMFRGLIFGGKWQLQGCRWV